MLTTVITGCATNQPKPAMLSDGTIGLTVRCVGTAVSWSKCYELANASCSSGFDIKDKEQYLIDNDFPVRILNYKCK